MSDQLQTTTQLAPALQERLNKLLIEIPKDRQLSWLQLSELKGNIKKQMEAEELRLQGLLKDFANMKAADLQVAVDSYKTGLKAMDEMRLSFTKYLDRIYDELMGVVKRASGLQAVQNGARMTWSPIQGHVLATAEAQLLKLKEQLEKEGTAQTQRAQELANFKAHVANEHVRIRADYEVNLNKTIVDSYTQALKDDLTQDGLKQYVTVTEAALRSVVKAIPIKFEWKLFNKEVPADYDVMLAASKSVPAPSYENILAGYITKMKEQFSLYFSDKANAEKATDFLRQQQATTEAQINDNASNATAVNQLVSKGSVPVFTMTDPNIKAIKRKYVIVLKDNDPIWAHKVLSEFIARWNTCAPRLKVTKWSNLTVKQMAAALQEEDEMIDGLQYEEIKK